MEKALQAVRLEGTSVRRAAEENGVPRSTLGDRVSGRVCHGAVSGPRRYLSEEEEEELVRFLLGCASMGYPKTRKEVLTLVQSHILRNRGMEKPITHGWWDSFCKRHPNLTFRTPASLSNARATAADHDLMMTSWNARSQIALRTNHVKYLTWMKLACPLIPDPEIRVLSW